MYIYGYFSVIHVSSHLKQLFPALIRKKKCRKKTEKKCRRKIMDVHKKLGF